MRRLQGLITVIMLLPGAVLAADGHADPHWTYEEQHDWGELRDPLYRPPYPYAECGIGQKQSPVNIQMSEVVPVESVDDLEPRYLPVPLSLTNNGHTLRANIDNGSLLFGHNA